MKVKRIEIQNFKGIVEANIDFNSNLNVFIGSNGAGKTTILEAIVANIYKFTSQFAAVNKFQRLHTTSEHINYNANFYKVDLVVTFAKIGEVLITQTKGFLSGEELIKDEKFQKFTTHFSQRLEENETVPIIKYYPSSSVTYAGHTNPPQKVYRTAQLEAWANLLHDDIAYSKLFRWFVDYEVRELRKQRDATDFEIELTELKHVREAISKALKILKGKDYIIKSDEIKRKGNHSLIPVLTLQEKGNGRTEILDNKSDGEKAVITLIADIAYNLSIAHGAADTTDYLVSPGIVLIDEIEAHLHPNWQREIIPLLRQLFPNIQFFITTHSPQVIASVNSENIFLCENFEFSKINIKSKGLDSNSLLKYVFNATERPRRYVDLIEQFEALMEQEVEIEKLEAIIDKVKILEQEDQGTDVSQLVSELELQLEAYKFDMAHEVD